MNWYRVEILKDEKIITATSKLAETKEDSINQMKDEHLNYKISNSYKYNSFLVYDGH